MEYPFYHIIWQTMWVLQKQIISLLSNSLTAGIISELDSSGGDVGVGGMFLAIGSSIDSLVLRCAVYRFYWEASLFPP